MAEENNWSSVEEMEEGNSKPPDEEEAKYKQDDEPKLDEKNDEQRRVSENNSSDCTAEKPSPEERGESPASYTETLTSVQISQSKSRSDFKQSSELLSEVPVEYSLQPLQETEDLKDQVSTVHEQPMNVRTGKPTSVTESSSSVLHTTLPGKGMAPVENGNNPSCLREQDKQNSRSPKPSSLAMLKTRDGYNWRKYGQKQVKSLDGFRSYYRCTFSDCYAKKIECCDRSNRVIETVYRSNHNHDPPRKVTSAKENKPALPIMPSTSCKEVLPVTDQIPETKQQDDSCGSDETVEINVKEEHVGGPEFKRRQKRSSTGEMESFTKTGKKPKFVVHAAGDVSISGDGYRWRKYGQKMVKGNPHPRNYYRCSSAGCPVRKHIEKAVDNTSSVVITYKGAHDHDMPVPRKRHGQIDKTIPCQTQIQTQWSVDKEGVLTSEAALNPVKDKTSESARTLLSIGFEIKRC